MSELISECTLMLGPKKMLLVSLEKGDNGERMVRFAIKFQYKPDGPFYWTKKNMNIQYDLFEKDVLPYLAKVCGKTVL